MIRINLGQAAFVLWLIAFSSAAAALTPGECMPLQELNAALKREGQHDVIRASVAPTVKNERGNDTVAALFTSSADGKYGYLIELDAIVSLIAKRGCVKLAFSDVVISDYRSGVVPPHLVLKTDAATVARRCKRQNSRFCLEHNAALRAMIEDGHGVAFSGVAYLDRHAPEADQTGLFTLVARREPDDGTLLLTTTQGATIFAPETTAFEWDGRKTVVAGVTMTQTERLTALRHSIKDSDYYAKRAIEQGSIKPGQENQFLEAQRKMIEFMLLERNKSRPFPTLEGVRYIEYGMKELKPRSH